MKFPFVLRSTHEKQNETLMKMCYAGTYLADALDKYWKKKPGYSEDKATLIATQQLLREDIKHSLQECIECRYGE